MKYPFQRPRLTKAEIDGFEPFERNRQIPLVVLWVAVALAIWGGVTLLGVRTPVTNGQLQSNGQVLAATPPHVASGPDIFSARCATCHQANAVGVKGAVPPLVGSTFASGDPSIIIQILLHGIDGPIEVSGATYNGHMPSFASVMSDEEIATITNYIQNSWGTNSHSIDRSAVATQRVRFGERKAWQGGFEIATILNPQTSSKLPDLKAIAADPKPTDTVVNQLVSVGRGAAWSCASCHGFLGQGSVTIPRLAGLNSDYIVRQLSDYASGQRGSASMKIVASGLTPVEMTMLAGYYSSLIAPSISRPFLQGDMRRGEQLATVGDWSHNVPACFSCHGSSGFGIAPNVPSLAAQDSAYIAAQLAAWSSGNRTSASLALMENVSKGLSANDRRAVADYLATLPPGPVFQTKTNGQ